MFLKRNPYPVESIYWSSYGWNDMMSGIYFRTIWEGFQDGVDWEWNKIGYGLVIVEEDIMFMAVHFTLYSWICLKISIISQNYVLPK